MKNIHLDKRTAKDIDQHIDRVHRDLGYTDGMIMLPQVRELLRLDLHYYQLDDPKLLDEVVHKLRVGAKQVINRPGLLLDAVRKFDLNALFIPDGKRILIDGRVPDLKKRWYESHEVAHSLIPWHAEYMLGDDKETLSQSCHQFIEAEANYGSGRLLFPHNNFTEARLSSEISIDHVRKLAKHFGNTITSTLWRCVEQSEHAIFAAVGEHPKHYCEGNSKIEYFVRSEKFEQQFQNVCEEDIWGWKQSYCGYNKSGPLGCSEIQVADIDGELQVLLMESFSNSHNVLTLGCWVRPQPIQVFF
ncbi:hypothetical protein SCD_n00264 [Sulfuricella denitrificans skB26]|uniref:IrrE N-terminal-like domain-containing protein n=1 Tax=Sulfuricella denitrificans (strain DSM 22764 / NBRC 105220 / skB26) TaxID=1163617 RepID=S6AAW4_SULDS|nr:hypothetical protein [Sulfuricella denitrificans]BAN34113.1 hypothetical protein SCD_n00264 [Sulfuricella denitrificans skB26]